MLRKIKNIRDIRRNNTKTIFAVMVSAVLAVCLIVPLAGQTVEASATIVYKGSIKLPNADYDIGVGKFATSSGAVALCIDHKKSTPPTGTGYTEERIKDADMAKALYYGWLGGGQWSGFPNSDVGIAFTSLLLSDFNTGSPNYDWLVMDGAKYTDFKAYVKAQGTEQSGNELTILRTTEANQDLALVNTKGKIELIKKSTNTDITNGNKCYSPAGAQYAVKQGNTTVATLTTNEYGKASAAIEQGSYKLVEVKAPRGYALDTTVKNVAVAAGKTAKIEVSDIPQNQPLKILLDKHSKETDLPIPQGAASLGDAQFSIDYYDGYYDTTAKARASGKPTRSWIVKTDEAGVVGLDEAHKISGDKFYTDSAGAFTLPLGTVLIYEKSPSSGYLLNEEVFVRQITSEGTVETVHTYNRPVIPEQIKRGDVELIKIEDTTLDRLANIPFKLTSKTTGESHVIATDENGYFSTEDSWNKHSNRLGINDAALNPDGSVDISKLENEAGTWFSMDIKGNTADVGNLGALPYDTYILDELPCESNRGLVLVEGLEFVIKRDNVTVNLGTLTDDIIKIETVATDKASGKHRTMPSANTTIVDKVEYEGLTPNKTYTMRGELYDKGTGKSLGIVAETEFTPKGRTGTVDVEFVFDSQKMAGKSAVVFEKILYNDLILAEHEDINNSHQTVSIGTNNIPQTGQTLFLIYIGLLAIAALIGLCILKIAKTLYGK